MIGTELSHFTITAKLGEGGMGAVYRARDTNLERDVAIKVLPEAFAGDAKRLTRFGREAKVLASLNHPHIAVIHGFEEVDGTHFIVMELVKGESLENQLARRGRLPVIDALESCRQIASALETAHEQGIIHRDLKPSNVMTAQDGMVKVLDFGLAKALKPPVSDTLRTDATTKSEALTSTGTMLGTTPYMSPEQVRGTDVDKRTDIWSFACLLYEVLTARRVYARGTMADTVSAVLEQEPDWAALPKDTPDSVGTLLRRCLRKDPKDRLRDIGDARIEIEEALAGVAGNALGEEELASQARRHPLLTWAFGVVAGLAVLVAVLSVMRTPPPGPRQAARLELSLPPGEFLDTRSFSSAIAVSPDGLHVVYAGRESELHSRLYVRAISDFSSRALPGTEGARGPFFSPDGQWVGFFADGKLQKVRLDGGTRTTICDVPKLSTGASWGPGGTIIFASFGSGLRQVPSGGGTPVDLTTPDTAKGELGHAWPHILPGGRDVLFTVALGQQFDLAHLSLETGEWRRVASGPSWGRILPNGHLAYLRGGRVWTEPFELEGRGSMGSPLLVLEDVFTSQLGVPHMAMSDTGTLVYATNPRVETKGTLVLVDRAGDTTPLFEEEDWYSNPRFSPSGKRVAVGIRSHIWVLDMERKTRTRLTHEGDNIRPVWSPDGARVAFASARTGSFDLYWTAADGSSDPEVLYESAYPQWPVSWSPDGQSLLFCELNPVTGGDIGALPVGERSVEEDPVPLRVLATRSDTAWASVSPDGRWLAYVSNESGQGEVYVEPFRGKGERWTISAEGGDWPMWSSDGQELFYLNGRQMMVVAVQAESTFAAGPPRLLFESPHAGSYDVSQDDESFLLRTRTGKLDPVSSLNVVLNWFTELEKSVLAGQ